MINSLQLDLKSTILKSLSQARKWLPTSTRSKTLIHFTIELQHEHTAEIKNTKIEITKEEVCA